MMEKAVQLQLAARERWLQKDEVLFLLTNYMASGLPVHVSPQCRPPSGTLFVCDSVMDFKKDGWTWQKQKGSKTKIREDRAKLVVTRGNVVLGVYVHSADNPCFHRRSYSLRDESNRMILVHYLEDDSKKQALRDAPHECSRPFDASSVVNDALADFHPSDPDDDHNDDDTALDDLLLDNHMPRMIAFDPSNQMMPPPPHVLDDSIPLLVQITDFSPNWDFCTGGAKILICAASPPPYSTLFVCFGSTAVVRAESLSPTVLRCCAPPSDTAGVVPLRIATYVGTQLIFVSTPGHFLFKPAASPSHMSVSSGVHQPPPKYPTLDWGTSKQVPAFSDVVAQGGGSNSSSSSTFKRARSEHNLDDMTSLSFPSSPTNSLRGLDELDDRQYKIRVVERLHEFRRVIISHPSAKNVADGGASTQPQSLLETCGHGGSGVADAGRLCDCRAERRRAGGAVGAAHRRRRQAIGGAGRHIPRTARRIELAGRRRTELIALRVLLQLRPARAAALVPRRKCQSAQCSRANPAAFSGGMWPLGHRAVVAVGTSRRRHARSRQLYSCGSR
ncbi:hypothetical protein, variant 2 [Aphanomyces astaci]|uniref:CG-1 domain-containing protein n=1 Tax=Aphanomyces astaci TaxID=112090 RepID=W4G4V6_APHAT|nr:hypothetical protein, variant 2 [Aphanomyces astaci]ETV74710.1 hypothetical protein, variant 2 [Aphanomyces astaci]|eukprot:XP_009835797.1 hypothetical protein, variant 2 [Aphanomyces astaci]